MAALQGHVREVLGEGLAERLSFQTVGREEFRVVCGEQSLTVRGYATLTRLLFGEGLAALPALPGGPLREALEALLPLPALQFDMTFA